MGLAFLPHSVTGLPGYGGSASQTNMANEALYHSEMSPTDKRKPAQPSVFVIHFRGVMQGLSVRAVLLPSLEAQYKVSNAMFRCLPFSCCVFK